MCNYRVSFINEKCEIAVSGGTTLLEAQIIAGLRPDAPCGGKGRCGKCIVDVRKAGEDSWNRLRACMEKIVCDIEVRTLNRSTGLNILTEAENADEIHWNPWVTVQENEITDQYMAAFDIGTTTIAGYLISVNARETVASASMLNPQAQYGADVISRMDYALKNGTSALTDLLRGAMNQMIIDMCRAANAQSEQVYAVSAVGNTCMHHILIGAELRQLAVAPYEPAVRGELALPAREYGLCVHPQAQLLLLPVIAGFVGADTVACMVSGQWQNRQKCTLLIDIGTNGEMVLGNAEGRIACSAAAGPALEGANISCGMRGETGAVDHVWLQDGEIRCHTIDDAEARGICGSGLVDMIAVLLETGAIDETGRILSGSDIRLGNTSVIITQKDIREIQLAKAAIGAGIRLMAEKAGTALCEIEEVHIAGAFGSFMNPESACRIGLIPSELKEKIRIVGNAAGEGAQRILKDKNAWADAVSLAKTTRYMELASMPEFQDAFVDELEFPE